MVWYGVPRRRLAAMRVWLTWLFLDEATAALDEDGERAMYELLQRRLPASSMVSIAHRSQVAKYHSTRLICATAAHGGAASLLVKHVQDESWRARHR
jgi:ABC-type uncharacterized transport system fused permease/ATPase subunit